MTNNIHDPYGLSRRRFLQASGLAAGGMALAACGGGDAASTTTAAGATDTTGAASPTTTAAGGTTETTAAGMAIPQSDLEVVRFDFNTPNPNLQAPYWVGISKGWFAEVGIDLRPENITGLDEYLPPMFADQIDIALMDAVVIFPSEDASVLDGAPNGLRWIGCALGYQPIVMIANEGITAENLAGKTVGLARAGTTNEVLAKFALSELGYDWETDVNAVNLTGGSNDWVTAMLTGQVDATLAFTRHIALAEDEGGSAIFTGFRMDPQAGWGMMQSKIDQYPMFPVAWNYAYIKANNWCKDPANWEEMREILTGEFNLDVPDNVFAALPIDGGMLTEDLGWNPDGMDELMAFSQPFGEYREDLPWRDYVYLDALYAAQDAHGLANNPSADLTTGETLAVPPEG
jgi:ABC-type nitrate/sulfonate/bicarbonate transport system substrate-binding protein